MLSLGIDPGIPTAFAVVDLKDPYKTFQYYLIEDKNLPDVVERISENSEEIAVCCVEMPSFFGKGSKGTANVFRSLGRWEMLLAALGLFDKTHFIIPKKWQDAYLEVPVHELEYIIPSGDKEKKRRTARKRNQNKKASVARANKMFNLELKMKDNHISDALWIAMYGRSLLLEL